MKRIVFATVCSLALVAGSSASALAAVNCGIVKKDLDRGRTPADISERMGISVSEVNKCKEQGGNGTTAATTARPAPGKPGTSPSEATNPNPHAK
ncbi:MAG TPA: hypothetical protein VN634_05175 [Candidatus Limnocylindrales bacterium]|nr:hypothetical protein [Candidatus Limnocylindrales bacterium]